MFYAVCVDGRCVAAAPFSRLQCISLNFTFSAPKDLHVGKFLSVTWKVNLVILLGHFYYDKIFNVRTSVWAVLTQ